MSTDVQRLSRTINLPRIPASFTPEQRAFFDDFARAITEHMRDTYDCLGVSNTSLKAHEGTKDAHGMAEAPTPGVGIIRTDEGKARVVPPDDLDGDDYVATIGSVRSFTDHTKATSEGIHGSSSSPSAGRIAMYSSGGRLKGANPVDSNDLVTKSFLSGMIVENKMTPILYCWGNLAAAANSLLGWYHREEDRTSQFDGTSFKLPAGKYLVTVNFPGVSFVLKNTAYSQVTIGPYLEGTNCIAQMMVLTAETTMAVQVNSAVAENKFDIQRGASITIISM